MADLVLREVRKSFDETEVIHGVDLDIEDGEFVVFVGPSGCGKSTLLRLIAGLEDITGGELRIGGELCNAQPPSERGVAMVFQSYALYPHMSVRENMAFALKLQRASKDEIAKRVKRAARILQIENLLERKPKQLSGGQRQRVAIGRAIVREPKVFLFDEPLSNLDAALRVQMRIEIAKLHKELATTIVYVTHDQVEAMTMADKIVVLAKGIVAQVGAPLELYNYPQNRFVAGFIGSPKMNFLDATLRSADASGATVELSGGFSVTASVDAADLDGGAPVALGIRPEHLVLLGDDSPAEGVARIPVEVALVEHLGEGTLVYVRVPGCRELIVCRTEGTTRVKDGQKIELGIPADECHLFAGHETFVDDDAEDSGAEDIEVVQTGRASFKRLVDIEN
ncbi:ABC transporter ATP-binding protein [Haliangium ochraceum]|uniref:ABC transporter related protein n=1 Tax=Haliangium ochraceum (strain DSM 14365 / JCM 11303 / SMP-2) TaxID=502025 RepID=D0LWJ3_HALO1|nr:sn-glycerol-3-phosphate ABC transporter ATP-binding protein UgpC [Haliangium ochraceum]ACY17643.1 ABC transporter related protein [Haliangium ochraceum DSM 14365]